jgi:predicted ATPase/transcriptional regulator with XRE-family HTH domain
MLSCQRGDSTLKTQRQPDSVAGLLRRYRITAGLSQEALAEKAGLSVRGLSDLERGLSRVPRLDTLTRIADALGLDSATRKSLVGASGHLGASPEMEVLREAPGPTTTPRVPSTLPGYLTGLIGREHDEAAVARLMRNRSTRLLTLTGPGGVGKTRLAVKVATGLADVFTDGVVFAPLAPVSDAALVLTTIAQALGVGERGDVSLFEATMHALRGRRVLLLLDNFEHVLDAAPVVADVLLACLDARIVVTSRALLRISGEHVYAVRPLALPKVDAGMTPDAATGSPAVALFLSRARAVHPDFALTPENVGSIVEVCRELDGLPLALELAAARIAVLPPAELLGRLKPGMSVLNTGRRDAPARHRGLRDAIAWSHDLLSAEQQRLFRWLGVFAGGWSLDLAESVCSDPLGTPSVFDGLAALVEHSLVQVQQGDETRESRFRLLETIREHAQERLSMSGEAPSARDRHAAAMLRLVEEAEPHLLKPDRERWLRQLDVELDNVRAAFTWSLSHEGNPEIGQRIAGSISWFWYLRGHLNEGEQWCEKLIARGVQTDYTPGSARVHGTLGGMRLMLGKGALARPHLAEAVRLFRLGADPRLPQAMTLLAIALTSMGLPREAAELFPECVSVAAKTGNAWFEAYALTSWGTATMQLGDLRAAEDLYRRSLALFSSLDDPWGRGIALRALAALAFDQADVASARAMAGEAVRTFRDTADVRGLAQALLGFARAALQDGSPNVAGEAFAEALGYWRDLGINGGVVRSVAGLAAVAARQGHLERAVHLQAATLRFARKYKVLFASADRADQQRLLDELRAQLGPERFGAESGNDAEMTFDEYVATALALPS